MLSVFSCPSRYTQGPNATSRLGAEIASLGLSGPLLVVAAPSAVRLLSDTWRASLGEAEMEYTVFTFGGECSRAEIGRVEDAVRAAKAQLVVGAGGGKVLDTARAAAAGLELPVVCCPTVASSDAPCSAISVIYTEEGTVEEIRTYGRNPDLVLVDTRVIAEAPLRFLVAGMGDALATVFEARACALADSRNTRGGGSTRAALALAELCYRTLLEDGVEALAAARSHTVTPALERIVEANTLLSGLGFESSGLAAAHSVHNGLTAAAGTRSSLHGEKVAFGTLVQLVLEGQERKQVEEVLRFATAVGLPVTLAEVGLPNLSGTVLNSIAVRATVSGETIHNEPFPVTPTMVAGAILGADSIGRSWKAAAG
ncbi:MAG: glycerol dehydrogenase [Acidithiobacillales bacterium]